MIPGEFPRDWYWLASDDRLYSSRRCSIVAAGTADQSFSDWKAKGLTPTAWPRDDDDMESDDALNAVLAPYGLTTHGAAPARLSFLQFMDLFTEDEQLAVAGAAMTDAPTKLWYDRAVGAQFIDLGDERLAAGLQKMVDAKLLTAARRDRILRGVAPL